jgi:hypothetical protein
MVCVIIIALDFVFYLFDLVAMYPSLKPTDKDYYDYYPEHSS